MAAIAYPTLDGVLATFRMTEAADMVRANWADARAYAMNEGRAYRFAVISGKGNFRETMAHARQTSAPEHSNA